MLPAYDDMPRHHHAPPPNILILQYEGLFSTLPGGLGGGRATPALDYFMRGGTTFPRTVASAGGEGATLASLMTGLYPPRHGVHEYDTKTDVATPLGYQPASVRDLVTNAFLCTYRCRLINAGIEVSRMRKSAWHNEPLEPDHLGQIGRLFTESRFGPFLLVDRLTSLSFPWGIGPGRADGVEDARHLARAAFGTKEGRGALRRAMEDRLLAEDQFLEGLIRLLDRHRLMDRTLVVLTGSGGTFTRDDLLGAWKASGGEGETPLFPTTFWCPGIVEPRLIDREAARHVDLFPTVAGLAGIPVPGKVDGVDLMAALRGEASLPGSGRTYWPDLIDLGGAEAASCSLRDGTEKGGTVGKERDEAARGLRPAARYGADRILKPTVFVMAHYRSATQFFATFFQRREFQNVHCPGHLWPDLYDVNVLYGEGILSHQQACDGILRYRPAIEYRQEEVLVSVSHDLWELVPLLGELFPNGRFILVARDPRSLMCSMASSRAGVQATRQKIFRPGNVFPPRKLVLEQGGGWLENWGHRWSGIMRSYLEGIETLGDRGIVVKYEEIFDGENGYPGMKRISGFLAEFLQIPTDNEWLRAAFSQKVDEYSKSHPVWEEWSADDRQTLEKYCGDMRIRLGYGINE